MAAGAVADTHALPPLHSRNPGWTPPTTAQLQQTSPRDVLIHTAQLCCCCCCYTCPYTHLVQVGLHARPHRLPVPGPRARANTHTAQQLLLIHMLPYSRSPGWTPRTTAPPPRTGPRARTASTCAQRRPAGGAARKGTLVWVMPSTVELLISRVWFKGLGMCDMDLRAARPSRI